jgi:hypothetical protein
MSNLLDIGIYKDNSNKYWWLYHLDDIIYLVVNFKNNNLYYNGINFRFLNIDLDSNDLDGQHPYPYAVHNREMIYLRKVC